MLQKRQTHPLFPSNIVSLSEVLLSRSHEKIDAYELIQFLGSGGSSTVYSARGPWERDVAIKLQTAALKRRRFIREFDILNKIQHPLLTPIYVFGIQPNGDAYLVMELIEGAYASRFTNHLNGKKKIQSAIRITATIANALGHLHKEDWIHGDIKAKNILVSKDGHPYIIDFELSRHVSETGKGKFFGTRSYAPPEQHDGLKLTPAADVYALAGLMCRMLCGQLPYAKMDNAVQAEKRRTVKPQLPKKIPARLLTILEQALSPDPNDRPQDGFAFSELLLKILPPKERYLALPIEMESGLSALIELLKQHRFSVPMRLRELQFLSGGNLDYANQICEHWQVSDSIPPNLYQHIHTIFLGFPKSLRQAIIITAAIGGKCPISFILKVTNIRKERLRKYLKRITDWVSVRSGILRIKLGILLSIAPQEADPEWLNQKLAMWRGRRGFQLASGFLLAQKNNSEQSAEFISTWMQRQINTQAQWLLLRKVQTLDIDLAWETQILTHRWNGDWISTLALYEHDEAKILQSALHMTPEHMDSLEEDLLKITEHTVPDLWVGACAILSEWYIANGHFSNALSLLQKLCKTNDVYTQQIGLKQRALLHYYLGQTALSLRVAQKLRQVCTTEQTLKDINKIENGEWNEHYLNLAQQPPLTAFLQARLQLLANTPDTMLIEHVIQTLGHADRAALYACMEWRDLAQMLNLPKQPQKEEYSKKSDEKCSH